MSGRAGRSAIGIVTIYVAISLLWTHASERALQAGTSDPVRLLWLGIVKDDLYTLATGALLFLLILRLLQRSASLQGELRDTQLLVNTFMERTPAAVYVKDADGRYVLMNTVGAAYLGRSVDDVIGSDDAALFPPAEAARIAALDREVMSSGEGRSEEQELTTAYGARNTFLTTRVPLFSPSGEVSGVFGMSRDISVSKHMEACLRASEARFRSLFENLQEGFAYCELIYDEWGEPADFVHLEVNEAYERVTGLAEVTGRRMREAVAGFHRRHPGVLERCARVVRDGRPESFELEFGDGQRWLSISLFSTEAPYFAAVFDNITARKAAETALQETSLRLRLATQAAGLGVWDWDIASGHVVWDDRMCAMYGLTPAEFKGMQDAWSSLVHPEDQARVAREVDAVLSGERAPILRFRIIHSDGSVRSLCSEAIVVRDDLGRPRRFIGINRDETEQLSLEAQFRQAQKMEAIGHLAGGVAHDFNNILTGVLGYADMLVAALPPDSEEREYIQEIIASSERAATLTRDLLAFSRRQVIQRLPVDLNEVVKGVENMLARVIGEDIRLQVVAAPTPVTVEADRGQLEQVLVNLATNARDAMMAGGTLSISTSATVLDEPLQCGGDRLSPGRYAVIAVSDTGSGMGRAQLDRLFEPFFTTKPVGKGTGLGLAMVYGTIRQHGGNVAVQSEVGAGSTFRIFLPLSAGCPIPVTRVQRGVQHGDETILLVEDDVDVRKVTRSTLESLGYRVIEAVDGDQGVQVYDAHKHEIDLVISDLIMPHMHGMDMLEALHRIRADVRVLFVSGYTADVLHSKGVDEEAVSLLYKPLRRDVLARRIREVLTAPRGTLLRARAEAGAGQGLAC